MAAGQRCFTMVNVADSTDVNACGFARSNFSLDTRSSSKTRIIGDITTHQPCNTPADLLNANKQKRKTGRRKEVVLIGRFESADLTLTIKRRALPTSSYISNIFGAGSGIEPASSAWKVEVIAIIRRPHPRTFRLPDFILH